jgi:uncharacterized SAM-binding protein YcdF (DUF218 family)
MDVIRSFFVIIGLIFTIWFFLPVVTGGILNIGNISGMLFFAIMAIFALIGPDRIRNFLPRGVITLLLILYLFFALAAVIIIIFMIRGSRTAWKNLGESDTQPPTIIVLGCKTGSRMMNKRIRVGIRLLKQYPDMVCILSGGTGPDENESEADYMYSRFIESGIRSERIYRETRSLNTFQNLKNSADIIRSEHLSRRVLIVTHEFHQYRACRIARRLRLIPRAENAATPWWLLPTYCSRECFAIVKEWSSTPI